MQFKIKFELIGLLALLLIIGSFFFWQKKDIPNANLSQEQKGEYDTYKKLIESSGDAKAYADFVAMNSKAASSGAQHASAHVFGMALFDARGLEGMGVCDSSFLYGCDHSFLGKAINQHGLEVLKQLDDFCNNKYGPKDSICQHSLGHGLIGYLGYEEGNLVEALEFCKELSDKGPIAGCRSGVFMEYNQRTMVDPSGSGAAARILGSDPHEPCSKISQEYSEACYNEQPHWWKIVYNWDWERIGNSCAQAPREDLALLCVRSIGASLASNFDSDWTKMSSACSYMPKNLISDCLQSAKEGAK